MAFIMKIYLEYIFACISEFCQWSQWILGEVNQNLHLPKSQWIWNCLGTGYPALIHQFLNEKAHALVVECGTGTVRKFFVSGHKRRIVTKMVHKWNRSFTSSFSVFILDNKSLHQAFMAKPMKPNYITRPQWVDEILFLHKFCCMENVWKLCHLTRYCGAFHHQTSNQLQTIIFLNAYILNTTT